MRHLGPGLLAVVFSALPASGAWDLSTVIRGIEQHYNRPKTMELAFAQTYTYRGRPPRTERGRLYLWKPKRMRWDYVDPAGKLFLVDGDNVYFYSPSTNRVEKTPLKESGDLRTPLAFLIGKLDLWRDFKEFRTRAEGDDLSITALPRSKNAPFLTVSFLVNRASRIKRLVIEGQDRSVMEFRFSGEKVNPPLGRRLFRFQMPPGAEFVEVSGNDAGED